MLLSPDFLRPYIAGGVAFSARNDWSVSAGFEGAPAGVPDMVVKQDAHDVMLRLSTGVELISGDDVMLRAQYDSRFADHYVDWGGLLKIGVRF